MGLIVPRNAIVMRNSRQGVIQRLENVIVCPVITKIIAGRNVPVANTAKTVRVVVSAPSKHGVIT